MEGCLMKRNSWVEGLSAGLALVTANRLFDEIHLHVAGSIGLVLLFSFAVVGALSVYRSFAYWLMQLKRKPVPTFP
jgi:hypothetical protein